MHDEHAIKKENQPNIHDLLLKEWKIHECGVCRKAGSCRVA